MAFDNIQRTDYHHTEVWPPLLHILSNCRVFLQHYLAFIWMLYILWTTVSAYCMDGTPNSYFADLFTFASSPKKTTTGMGFFLAALQIISSIWVWNSAIRFCFQSMDRPFWLCFSTLATWEGAHMSHGEWACSLNDSCWVRWNSSAFIRSTSLPVFPSLLKVPFCQPFPVRHNFLMLQHQCNCVFLLGSMCIIWRLWYSSYLHPANFLLCISAAPWHSRGFG
jgi:hypothetical protein